MEAPPQAKKDPFQAIRFLLNDERFGWVFRDHPNMEEINQLIKMARVLAERLDMDHESVWCNMLLENPDMRDNRMLERDKHFILKLDLIKLFSLDQIKTVEDLKAIKLLADVFSYREAMNHNRRLEVIRRIGWDKCKMYVEAHRVDYDLLGLLVKADPETYGSPTKIANALQAFLETCDKIAEQVFDEQMPGSQEVTLIESVAREITEDENHPLAKAIEEANRDLPKEVSDSIKRRVINLMTAAMHSGIR